MGFIEDIHSPDQAAFNVAPSAEILDVQIPYCQYLWSFGQPGANVRPDLCPTVIRCSQKQEYPRLHLGMLEVEIFCDDGRSARQPFFKLARGFHYIHIANIEAGWSGSQRG